MLFSIVVFRLILFNIHSIRVFSYMQTLNYMFLCFLLVTITLTKSLLYIYGSETLKWWNLQILKKIKD